MKSRHRYGKSQKLNFLSHLIFWNAITQMCAFGCEPGAMSRWNCHQDIQTLFNVLILVKKFKHWSILTVFSNQSSTFLSITSEICWKYQLTDSLKRFQIIPFYCCHKNRSFTFHETKLLSFTPANDYIFVKTQFCEISGRFPDLRPGPISQTRAEECLGSSNIFSSIFI